MDERNGRPRLARALLGTVACLAALTVYACGATGSVSTEGQLEFPGIGTLGFQGTVGNHPEYAVDVGAALAGACIEVRWTDAKGELVRADLVVTDAGGHASGPVPEGAVRFEAVLTDCPEPEDEGGAGEALLPFGTPLGTPPGAPGQGASPTSERTQVELRRYLVWGGPLVPSADPGAQNRTYALDVRAGSFAGADALVDHVLGAGIGAPVPVGVTVLLHATMEPVDGGARLVQAQPGRFQHWALDWNSGAFRADMHRGSLHYAVGTWDVVETLVPLSVIAFGSTPGFSYSNVGLVAYRTDAMAGLARSRQAVYLTN